jgi:hypothetical protein
MKAVNLPKASLHRDVITALRTVAIVWANVIKGIPSAAKGVPFEIKGIPSRAKGVPSGVKDVPSAVKGVPFEAKGTIPAPQSAHSGINNCLR